MPVWLMRQAGRYLPEYRQTREQAGGFLKLCLTPDLAAEVTLQPVRRFEMDAAILFSDLPLVSYGLGQTLDYREGEGPVLDPIRCAADIDRLSLDAIAERLAPVCETVRLVRQAQPVDCTLIGFSGGAWTVMAYMIEGRGKGEFEQAKRMAWAEPALFDRLAHLVTDGIATFLNLQIDAGAEVVQLFDSWAGLLDDDLFRRYVIAPTRRIVDLVRARHPHTPIIGFPRLAGLNYRAYARETGVTALGLDTTVPLGLGPETGLPTQGNLDPALLLVGGQALQNDIRRIAAATAGHPHIFNLGHGVSQHTDPDMVARLVEGVQQAGK
jgi:uroporphyrinogen decarboxylase